MIDFEETFSDDKRSSEARGTPGEVKATDYLSCDNTSSRPESENQDIPQFDFAGEESKLAAQDDDRMFEQMMEDNLNARRPESTRAENRRSSQIERSQTQQLAPAATPRMSMKQRRLAPTLAPTSSSEMKRVRNEAEEFHKKRQPALTNPSKPKATP